MKVCDRHRDKEAVDTIVIEKDGTHIDVCQACKEAVLEVFTKPEKQGLLKKVFGKSE